MSLMEAAPTAPEDGSYEHRFGGIGRLYGRRGLARLRASRVLVVGVGGVGSWVAEALARSGIGNLSLLDFDDICFSNVNRQIHALSGTQGRAKVEVLRERIALINPECAVHALVDGFTPENALEHLDPAPDYVVDCIDGVTAKVHLIAQCRRLRIPIVVCGGAGGRVNPSRIMASDLARTLNDPLLAMVRKLLRRHHGFPRDPKRKFGIAAVFSDELPRYPAADGEVSSCAPASAPGENRRLDCRVGFGTTTFMTGSFAFHLAAQVVNDLVQQAAKAAVLPVGEAKPELDSESRNL